MEYAANLCIGWRLVIGPRARPDGRLQEGLYRARGGPGIGSGTS